MPILRKFASPPKISNKKIGGAAAAGDKLFSWGENTVGQLGLGDTANRSSPVQVGTLTNWSTPVAAQYHMCCNKTDGTLWTWGGGSDGKLGLGNSTDRSSPTQVGALTTWAKPSAGRSNTGCIKTDGTIWMWGSSSYGELGNNSTSPVNSPIQIGSSTTWSEISVGSNWVLAVDNGKLFAWGYNSKGQLGQGNTTNRSSPVQIGSASDWVKPSAPGFLYAHGLCTKTNGTLWSWGNNSQGQLGLGDTTNRSSPVQIGALTNWATPSNGSAFSLCVKTDGTLWVWGANGGRGAIPGGDRNSPVQVGALTNWLIPSAGAGFGLCTQTAPATLWDWGSNSYGSLGQGNTTDRYGSPVQVGTLLTWAKADAGRTFCLATQS
jgi:alpha-tubulin suppressor-like RCC1 family protein